MTCYCSHCGTILQPASRFCSGCGTAVTGTKYTDQPPYGYAPWGYPTQRLFRPIFGRQFAGVCSGVARAYGWDVGVVRIVTVLGAIFFCPVVEIAYLAGWIGIPEEPLYEMPPMAPPPPQQA
jgi:phage shock protein PspC (stress-responsive transcriptional regulator)